MQMGDEIMVEPSRNPDLAGFNLLTKVMVKLAKVLPKGPGQEVQPGCINTWMLTVEILFMFTRHAEGLGHKARMLMRDAKVIVCGEVKCTGLLVEWELHRRTRGREWEVLIDKELVNLKASMDAGMHKRPLAPLAILPAFRICVVGVQVSSDDRETMMDPVSYRPWESVQEERIPLSVC
ncbi:hypothetical protein PAXRUDRAFT_14574 [Paxillus rubicundulus Ve08.2h10]|uniref:Uncharacterized protein n=1 Tax=Paxillus rubicundulus Ve08.2h10 TaxID=930991 RepID=A0A0D0DNB2_9AGAM|nr:hypothetical protein PAXRUDRAFT_14574 [Paxillus rubicundulus Ve08.2h10]